MEARKRLSGPQVVGIAAGFTVAAILAGCRSGAPDDSALTSQVNSRLAADQNLGGQSVQASAAGGVVTLSGTVTSDAARAQAGGDAAQVAGVRTVVNNLTVLAPPASATVTSPPLPAVPTERVPRQPAVLAERTPHSAPIQRTAPPPAVVSAQPAAPPPPVQAQAPPPPPPPPPMLHNITLPAGTTIPVRITQTLNSGTTQTGDNFTGAVASDIIVDGLVVLPQGTPVTGHVDEAKDAAHFKGSALLTLSLTAINRRGERISVATDPYTKEGQGRGTNTAEKVGGGAAVGAILGGIFGGGRGAAIGSVAGGGVGAGAQGVTRGQQVEIPSETVVRFRLSNAMIVRDVKANSDSSGAGLDRHTD